MKAEEICLRLLDILYRVAQATKGESAGPNGIFLDARGLIFKVFAHAASTLHLSRRTLIKDLPSVEVNFVDPGSIHVLVRAALEAFLTLHYLYVTPASDEERELRYLSWQIAGLMERQDYPILSSRVVERKAQDMSVIEKWRTKLSSNPLFNQLTARQREGISNGQYRLLPLSLPGAWEIPSWRKLAESADLAKFYADIGYSFLSGYAHSTSLSVLQMIQANSLAAQQQSVTGSIGILNIILANAITCYSELFPKAKAALQSDPAAALLVQVWVGVGKSDLPRLAP